MHFSFSTKRQVLNEFSFEIVCGDSDNYVVSYL